MALTNDDFRAAQKRRVEDLIERIKPISRQTADLLADPGLAEWERQALAEAICSCVNLTLATLAGLDG